MGFMRCERRILRLHRPRINDINAAALKVLHVARSEACSSRTSHRDNHGIELADGVACHSSRGRDLGIRIRSIAVETQHLTGEIFVKNLLRGIPREWNPREIRSANARLPAPCAECRVLPPPLSGRGGLQIPFLS
jgi:hypothetical protein